MPAILDSQGVEGVERVVEKKPNYFRLSIKQILVGLIVTAVCGVVIWCMLEKMLCVVKDVRRNVMLGHRDHEVNKIYIGRYANITAYYFTKDIKTKMDEELNYQVNDQDLDVFYQTIYKQIINMSQTHMSLEFKKDGDQQLRVNISIVFEQNSNMNDINVTTKYCFDLYYYECKTIASLPYFSDFFN
eukprot:UN05685